MSNAETAQSSHAETRLYHTASVVGVLQERRGPHVGTNATRMWVKMNVGANATSNLRVG